MKIDDLLQATKEELFPARYEHTLRVMETAIQLAKQINGLETEKVAVAAVLHDFCKCWPTIKLSQWIEHELNNLDLLLYDKELWHAPVGAEVVRSRFGVEDEDILNAIRFHTTGRPNMSILEKVIFIADVVEPGRSFPGVDELRSLANSNLNQAILTSLNHTIRFLLDKGKKIYPLTLETRNALLDTLVKDKKEE
ncbi:putative HD superfamily hydrolase of NAD metabolism [Seinonella peptonophila]|uniref:bis(5'-nucleosyl)-tetraphosphatase (symmetrical) n=1 Tax=Seinonella peptonophila TaxID=112248 RepID=A0A1M4W866_9BACL|nr:bis(5'-nucleosyl)-tetraphosphatase (symmetrical) YqeK [Seinonella peptonophila]SHE77172.1 putative HD superfamily hydrolase of NAD metabolism [Seinonella peptonophila]